MTTIDVSRTRAAFAAFAAGDLEALREDFAPDIVWHVPGRSPLAGEHRGADAVFGYFGELFARSGGTFRADLLECGEIAPGLVASLVRFTGDMTGGRLDVRGVMIAQHVDGRTAEVWNFVEDQYAMDESTGPLAISLPDARQPEAPISSAT